MNTRSRDAPSTDRPGSANSPTSPAAPPRRRRQAAGARLLPDARLRSASPAAPAATAGAAPRDTDALAAALVVAHARADASDAALAVARRRSTSPAVPAAAASAVTLSADALVAALAVAANSVPAQQTVAAQLEFSIKDPFQPGDYPRMVEDFNALTVGLVDERVLSGVVMRAVKQHPDLLLRLRRAHPVTPATADALLAALLPLLVTPATRLAATDRIHTMRQPATVDAEE